MCQRTDEAAGEIGWLVPGACLLLMIMVTAPLSAQQPADSPVEAATDLDTENARRRLDFINKASSRFELTVHEETDAVSRLIPGPLLRWSNPQSTASDGVLIGFSRGGRPDVLAQFAMHSEKNIVHEFHATCERPLSMKRDGQGEFWRYDVPSIEFRTLSGVKPPVDSETARMVQFRQIGESFEVFDEHGWTRPVRQVLRLLRQPVYRYHDEKAGIIDGVVMPFVLGTDPEAILMIEAFQSEDGPQWRYAFCEMTIYALQAFRSGEMVWEKPDRRVFCQSGVAHYVCPYRPAPDDPSLKGAFQTGRAEVKPTPAKK